MKEKMAFSNQQVMETWFRRVWSEEDAAAIAELYVPDGPVRGLGKNPMLGPNDFQVFQSALLSLVSDVQITIDKGVNDDQWYSMICSFSAKNRQTGDPINATGSAMVRIVDGTIREAYNHWDFIAIYEQLGLLPQDTFAVALTGNKVV